MAAAGETWGTKADSWKLIESDFPGAATATLGAGNLFFFEEKKGKKRKEKKKEKKEKKKKRESVCEREKKKREGEGRTAKQKLNILPSEPACMERTEQTKSLSCNCRDLFFLSFFFFFRLLLGH